MPTIRRRDKHDPKANTDLWSLDSIQFPRLLAEIYMVGLDRHQTQELCESMDISKEELKELFERAEKTWTAITGAQL